MRAVEVSVPRVSDVPPNVSPDGFHSEIVLRYQRRSRTQARLLARLYLEGLASGDFEPVFRTLVGETAALSPTSILKLKADWQHEYESWKKCPLRGRYVHLYADGFYLRAGGDHDKTAGAGRAGYRPPDPHLRDAPMLPTAAPHAGSSGQFVRDGT
jgi:hypothetical protein